VTTGEWDEVAAYVEFMGYTQPWYSVRDLAEPVGGDMGYVTCFLRDGDRAFLPRGLARGARPVQVLALGLRRERRLGPDQPPRAAVDPPGATPVETLGRPGDHH
jgi:hypothetical protein